MKVNISSRFLIFNAHQHFLDEFFKEGMDYTYSGVDLGLGVIFVASIDEVEMNATLFLPLFDDDSFLWIAYSITPHEQEAMSEAQIVDEMLKLGLKPTESINVGLEWKMTRFAK